MGSFVEMSCWQNLYQYTDHFLTDDYLNFSAPTVSVQFGTVNLYCSNVLVHMHANIYEKLNRSACIRALSAGQGLCFVQNVYIMMAHNV